jgi:hypothetical protein
LTAATTAAGPAQLQNGRDHAQKGRALRAPRERSRRRFFDSQNTIEWTCSAHIEKRSIQFGPIPSEKKIHLVSTYPHGDGRHCGHCGGEAQEVGSGVLGASFDDDW